MDTYNQVVYTDIAPTITTRVDASSHIFVMEEVKVNQVGNLVDDSDMNFTNPQRGRVYATDGLSPCLTTNLVMGGVIEEVKMETKDKIIKIGNYSPSNHNASSVVDTEGVTPAVMENHGTVTAIAESLKIPQATAQGYAEVQEGGVFDAAYPDSKTRRGRVQEGGSVTPTILTSNELSLYEGVKNGQFRIRKLTPRECFRLMGVSEENIDKIQAAGISNSQQYKMAGNSIVVDTLYHIFKKMFIDKESEQEQLTLF